MKPKVTRCAWCGRDIEPSTRGRARKYCRQSCRQRAYEQRNAVAGTSIPADATILKAEDVATLRDQLYAVRCAAQDVATAVREGADPDEVDSLVEELVSLAEEAERFR